MVFVDAYWYLSACIGFDERTSIQAAFILYKFKARRLHGHSFLTLFAILYYSCPILLGIALLFLHPSPNIHLDTRLQSCTDLLFTGEPLQFLVQRAQIQRLVVATNLKTVIVLMLLG